MTHWFVWQKTAMVDAEKWKWLLLICAWINSVDLQRFSNFLYLFQAIHVSFYCLFISSNRYSMDWSIYFRHISWGWRMEKEGGKVGLAKLTVRPTPCRPHSQPPSAFFCFREELRWSIRTFARGQSLRSRMGKWWHFGKTFGLMKHSYALHFLGSALAAATKILWSINAFIQGEIPKKMLVQILNLSILPHSKKIKIFFRYNV